MAVKIAVVSRGVGKVFYTELVAALKKTHGVELEENDKVEFEHNYCDHAVVDVVVTDGNTNEKYTFPAFNCRFGGFPY